MIGFHVAETETFPVVDLFEDLPQGSGARTENDELYARLSQRAFESNYGRFHTRMPVVVRAPTSEVLSHARAGANRFVHVDASHLYEDVRGDVLAARALLAPGGIVVFDDFRSPHTPGTAAAAWEAITTGDVQPIVVSDNKLYATRGDAAAWQETLLRWAPTAGLWAAVQAVLG